MTHRVEYVPRSHYQRRQYRAASVAVATLAAVIIGSASPAYAPPRGEGTFRDDARLDTSQVTAPDPCYYDAPSDTLTCVTTP